ncbi:MAG: right-handed parallel beta-helix repeat-containing protein [Sedimentisphaerales bacterium]|nr:right-handed parallel beta-helix repeat-containing protein [Sedimentisphaerales bacterium]
MMRKTLLVLGIVLCGSVAWARDYYVAVEGNDANPGTIEKPFATLEKARDAIRETRPEGATVVIRGGKHFRSQAFTLTEQDPGTVYRAYPGETVRLIGGREISANAFGPRARTGPDGQSGFIVGPDWRYVIRDRLRGEARGRCKAALVLRELRRSTDPLRNELSFNGELMQLARWPNEGFVRTTSAENDITFGYDDPRPEQWLKAPDACALGYWCHGWSNQIVKIAKIDTQNKTITAEKTPPYGIRADKPYYVINLAEEIDQPGEWYVDREEYILCFWPPAEMDEAEILLSTLDAPIIRLDNAAHVRIENLTVEMGTDSGIEIDGGHDNLIADCLIRNIRGTGIEVSGMRNGVERCTISGIGQTGVSVSGGNRKQLTPGENFVRDCTIHDFGRWQRTYAPAIRLDGVGNVAAHNLLYDAPHSAILFGGNEHLIELNEIHDVCYEVDDAGSVYCGRDWGLRGNVIRNNFFHHIRSHLPGSNGVHAVYLDDCASGITVFGNIFYEISGRAIMCGGGRDNTIENNVIAKCGSAHFTDRRGTVWADKDQQSWNLLAKIQRYNYTQPPWSERYPRLAHLLDNGYDRAKEPEGCIIARNIGWRNQRWLEKNSLGGSGGFDFYTFTDNIEDRDPCFVDEAALNLALRDESPAYTLSGFKPIPFDQIGPKKP